MSATDPQQLEWPWAEAAKGKEPPPLAERLLTMKELAGRLQVSRVTAWRLVAERGLKCIRIGRSVRIRERDLEAWLDKHSTAGGQREGKVQP